MRNDRISAYSYWALKIRGDQRYVGSGKGSGKPYSKVALDKRIRYLSAETARRAASYLRQFGDDDFVIVRVNCKCKVATREWHYVDVQPLSTSSNRNCPRCGPMQDCSHSISHFCHMCGPMNYCMCNEDTPPRYGM